MHDQAHDADRFPWFVKCFYADDVEPPRVPGRLAIETKHATEASRDMEVEAAKGNPYIGVVTTGRR